MEAIARIKYQRGSAKKVRLVADLIRGKNVLEAKQILAFSRRKAGRILMKVINAAIANAANKARKIEPDKLVVSRIFVDEGPTLKRYRPRAMGRADLLRRRTFHVTMAVSDENTKETKESVNGTEN
ncbi:MAG: 50S ribosomal protein L22 [Candidatus Cloacimonadia bacterium]